MLHQAATEGRFGVASMVEWLQHRMAEAAADQAEERSRRLESDAESVQVITVHRSKGLEFPVVYAPFLWDRFVPRTPDPLTLHDPAGARVLDVGGPDGEGYAARRAVHASEDAGESLRLAYVALTRASAHVVAHWAPTSNTRNGPLHRLLFADRSPAGDAARAGHRRVRRLRPPPARRARRRLGRDDRRRVRLRRRPAVAAARSDVPLASRCAPSTGSSTWPGPARPTPVSPPGCTSSRPPG